MHFLEHNMKVLLKHNPELYKQLNSVPRLSFPDNSVMFGTNDNGEVFVVLNNMMPIDSPDIYQSWLNNVNPDTKTIFVYGFGMGLTLEKLIEKHPEKDIYVIEPDIRHIWFSFHMRDMESIIRSCKFVVDVEPEIARQKIHECVLNPTSKGVQLILYSLLYPEYINKLCYDCENFLSDWSIMINTKQKLIASWYNNRFKNARCNSVSIKGLLDKFKGMPAILCGAAPSLKTQIDMIKSLQGKAAIVACSTAAEILISNGITPTFMTAIDGDPITSGGLHENLESDVPLMFDGQIAPNSLRYKGKKFQFCLNVNKYTNLVIPELPIIESAPSVSNVSLDLLIKMGFDPIIMVGQDLSYSDNKMYCDGTRFQQDMTGKTSMVIADYKGDNTFTEPAYISIRNWFESYVDRFKNEGLRINKAIQKAIGELDFNRVAELLRQQSDILSVKLPDIYNCSASGIDIMHIPRRDFIETIKFYGIGSKEYDFGNIINAAYYKPDGTPDYIDVSLIDKAIGLIITDLEQIKAVVSQEKTIVPQLIQIRCFPLYLDFVDAFLYLTEVKAELNIDRDTALKELMDIKADILVKGAERIIELLKEN